jgi:vacuolar-type H+-ATPase catalytic subunit A/Vma1
MFDQFDPQSFQEVVASLSSTSGRTYPAKEVEEICWEKYREELNAIWAETSSSWDDKKKYLRSKLEAGDRLRELCRTLASRLGVSPFKIHECIYRCS